MNKEEVLTRFYTKKLQRDFDYLFNCKVIQGVMYDNIEEVITGPEEYISMLIELLKANGFYKNN